MFCVLPFGNAKAVVVAITGAANVTWLHLWYLEGPEADEGAELDDQVVATRRRGAAEFFDLVVGEPHFVSLAGAVLSHTDYRDKLLQIPSYLIERRPAGGRILGSTALAAVLCLRFV